MKKTFWKDLSIAAIFLTVMSFTGQAADSTPKSLKEKNYKFTEPKWAFQISAGPNCIFYCGNAEDSVMPIAFDLGYQPFHGIGILGFQIESAFYLPQNTAFDRMFSVALKANYQFKYSPLQMLVPVTSAQIMTSTYGYNKDIDGFFKGGGWAVGLWVDLSLVDSNTAQRVFTDSGFSRFYLTFERRSQNVTDTENTFSFRGAFYQIGLRAEI